MPFRSALHRLLDIRDNARLAQRWAADTTREAFATDLRIFYAVTRCLEIISEACRHLPDELPDRHPGLPWRAIMDVGNVYRHAYDNVSEDAVWNTVKHDLTPLLVAIEVEIASCGPPP